MQQVMTQWIEDADARAVCNQAMAERMPANASAQADEPRSLAAMLRLDLLNRCFGLGHGARVGL